MGVFTMFPSRSMCVQAKKILNNRAFKIIGIPNSEKNQKMVARRLKISSDGITTLNLTPRLVKKLGESFSSHPSASGPFGDIGAAIITLGADRIGLTDSRVFPIKTWDKIVQGFVRLEREKKLSLTTTVDPNFKVQNEKEQNWLFPEVDRIAISRTDKVFPLITALFTGLGVGSVCLDQYYFNGRGTKAIVTTLFLTNIFVGANVSCYLTDEAITDIWVKSAIKRNLIH